MWTGLELTILCEFSLILTDVSAPHAPLLSGVFVQDSDQLDDSRRSLPRVCCAGPVPTLASWLQPHYALKCTNNNKQHNDCCFLQRLLTLKRRWCRAVQSATPILSRL